MIDLGDTYSTGFEVRDEAGTLINPASSACTLQLPDGTSVTPALTNPSVGLLRLDYATTLEGRHSGHVVTTNPNRLQPFVFNVGPAYSVGIVTLAEAEEHLNIDAASTAHDEELRRWIDSMTSVIENGDDRKFAGIGPVVNRTVVETVPGGGMLILSKTPVVSLTSIVGAYGVSATYDVSALFLDGAAGHVMPAYGTTFWPSWLTVTYIAGRGSIVPPAVIDAALIVLKNMWETQRARGPGLPALGGDETAPSPTAPAYLLPYRAMSLLGGFERKLPVVG